MAEFLVEVYLRRDDPYAARSSAERAERAAAELRREGWGVDCVRSIFVPEDETFLVLFQAPSVEVVTEALSRAGLRSEHISTASSSEPGPSATQSPQTQGKAFA